MNEEEIPSVSVRQRAAAINRTLKEEQYKSQYVNQLKNENKNIYCFFLLINT